MKANPTQLPHDLLSELIRDTQSALDFLEALWDQADSDGDKATASVLRSVWERMDHAGDEFQVAEALLKSAEKQPKRPRPSARKRPLRA